MHTAAASARCSRSTISAAFRTRRPPRSRLPSAAISSAIPGERLVRDRSGATCPAIWESERPRRGRVGHAGGRAATLAACDIAYDACGSAKLCGSSAKLISFPLADRDVAEIGIDQAYHLATIDPALAGAGVQPLGASAALAQLTVPLTAGLVVNSVAKADLDGDGRPELVLPFRSDDRTDFAGGRIAICQVDDQGLVARCDDVRDLDVTGTLPGLIAPMRERASRPARSGSTLFGATTQDLALACKGGVYLLSHASGTYRASKLVDIEALYLDLANVNADGVDDLIVMTFDQTLIAQVYPQWEARYPTCGAYGEARGGLLLALAGTASADEKTAERYFRAGEKAYAAQNFAAAAQNFEEAYKELPLPEIAFSAAQAYRRQYRVEQRPGVRQARGRALPRVPRRR